MWAEARAEYRADAEAPRRAVKVALDLQGLAIRDGSGRQVDFWPFGNLVRLKEPKDRLSIGIVGGRERVTITDPAAAATFRKALKEVPVEGATRIPVAFIAAVLAMVAILTAVVGILLWLVVSAASAFAPLVPEDLVEALDGASRPQVLAELGAEPGGQCRSEAGVAALDRLADRLADAGGARQMTLDVGVWRSPVPNAVALPGGTIIITSALLDRVDRADAFAGVLAHEIGHVHHRHGLQSVLHAGGLALLVSAVTGDVSIAGSAAHVLLTARYSREAEREADRFAVDAVALAGGDARALGAFLTALPQGPEGGPLDLFASHPMSDDRRVAIETQAADRAPRAGVLVPPADWSAIVRICG